MLRLRVRRSRLRLAIGAGGHVIALALAIAAPLPGIAKIAAAGVLLVSWRHHRRVGRRAINQLWIHPQSAKLWIAPLARDRRPGRPVARCLRIQSYRRWGLGSPLAISISAFAVGCQSPEDAGTEQFLLFRDAVDSNDFRRLDVMLRYIKPD